MLVILCRAARGRVGDNAKGRVVCQRQITRIHPFANRQEPIEDDHGFNRTHLEERPNVPAVGEQVGRPAGVRSNPHLRVRLIDVHFERSVAGGLEVGHHALFTGLTPRIFLAAEKSVPGRASNT